MKEIKFRSWSKDNKKMLYGNDLQGRVFFGNDGVGTIGTSFILMQYTGLKDKNGEMIYEGDIVDFENGYSDEIIEDKGCFRLINERYMDDLSHGVVIGNKFENPELISKNN